MNLNAMKRTGVKMCAHGDEAWLNPGALYFIPSKIEIKFRVKTFFNYCIEL
jgi:hypothetical protein